MFSPAWRSMIFDKKLGSQVKKIFLISLLMSVTLMAFGETLEDARLLLNEGDFSRAREIARSEAEKNPKITSTPLYNYVVGVCDFEEGDYPEARKKLESAKSKGYAQANLYLGRIAFLDYDFEKAADFYSDYRENRAKLKQDPGETVSELETRLSIAENALERVEKIVIIDSLAVPSIDFFKAYRLPHSSGRLIPPVEMPLAEHRTGAEMAFINEGADFMMWGEPDSVGNVRLVESVRLTDGTWQEPSALPEFLSKDGYSDFPFMMPDGVTLYYASDGLDSMGGYDIFVVTRDSQTGDYLQPQNIGMPFNSPYDDYMLAIDEENGIGWWATDRNNLGDKVTIYVYAVNDIRKNHDSEEEDIIDKARISSYRSTWNPMEETRYEELLDKIRKIDNVNIEESPEFFIPKGNGEYYTSEGDFKNSASRAAVRAYLGAQWALEKSEENLRSLRKRYARNHADNVKEMIKTEEAAIEKERTNLIKLRSEIYRCEKGGK